MKMPARPELPIEAIASICRKHGVRTMDLFGSAARGKFDATSSDFDFIVDFGDTDLGPWACRLVAFRDEVQLVLGRQVDIVTLNAVRQNPGWSDANAEKVPVYAAA